MTYSGVLSGKSISGRVGDKSSKSTFKLDRIIFFFIYLSSFEFFIYFYHFYHFLSFLLFYFFFFYFDTRSDQNNTIRSASADNVEWVMQIRHAVCSECRYED